MDKHIIGMCSLIELADLEAHAELCESLGFSFIELNMNLPIFQMPKLDIRLYEKISKRFKIFYTLHLDENFDVCCYNTLVARAWQDTALQAIVLAKQLGIPIINMHLPPGIYFTAPTQRIYIYARNKAEYLFRLRCFRDLCERAIGEDDITVCVENGGAFREFQHEAIALLMESPRFGLTLDIGHEYASGNVNSDIFAAHAGKIAHTHIHDATRERCHLHLGEGDVPLEMELTLARRRGCRCVIETKTAAALTDSAVYLRRLLDGANG